MKLAAAIILFLLLALLGVQIFKFLSKETEVRGNFADLRAKLNKAKEDQAQFQAELDYYMNPANLEKELRARFNYKNPGENLIIIVPPKDQSSTAAPPAMGH